MFDGLKKKLANAVKSFIKTEKEEAAVESKEEKKQEPAVEVKRIEEKIGEENQAGREEPQYPEAREEAESKKGGMAKLSLKTKIKSVFVSSIRLSDSDIERFMDTVKISMLQSDVSYSTTEDFLDSLKAQMKSTEVSTKDIEGEIIGMVRNSLLSILSTAAPIDLAQFIKKRVSEGGKPVKVLFLGPNGTGKTTTIAKLAYGFKGMGISCVLSASDTFRAAAIEQMVHHANAIGVPVIKSVYGADPASVAFDAIAYAKAHSMDAVLIDSAGRQETNKSLIEEMKKMVRVSNPDLVIFVGESTAGNVITEQINEFGKFMKIDGIILTKLDCDAKGGGVLSIVHATGRPVLYFGTGQGYDALVPYTSSFVIDAILPNS
jgi:fused signal recognition particle receptor